MYDIQEPLNLLKAGRSAEAIPILERLVARTPGHVTAHVLLARAYQAEDRWEDALGAWQNASFLMPSSPVIISGFKNVLAVLSQDLHVEDTRAADEDEYEVVSVKIKGPPRIVHELPPELPAVEDDTAEPIQTVTRKPFDPGPPVVLPIGPPPLPIAEPEPELEEPQPLPEADIPPAGLTEEELKQLPPMVRDVAKRTPIESPPAIPLGEADELDRLIEELESARIVPKPEQEDLPTPELENSVEGMASETLATIYAAQREFEAAAKVYDELARMHPDKAEAYGQKAAEMRNKA